MVHNILKLSRLEIRYAVRSDLKAVQYIHFAEFTSSR